MQTFIPERFKSENVETVSSFLKVLRYILQNPVKAGLANNIFECSWTSIDEFYGHATLVDTEFPLHLFSPIRSKSLQLFSDYMQLSNDDQCLDDHPKVRMSDSEIRRYLAKFGFTDHSTLQRMEKAKRDAIIREMRSLNGVSIRQLARITGISKSVIARIR